MKRKAITGLKWIDKKIIHIEELMDEIIKDYLEYILLIIGMILIMLYVIIVKFKLNINNIFK